MNRINDEIKALVSTEIKPNGEIIIQDGIVNEAIFQKSDRILYLLKDMNGMYCHDTQNDSFDALSAVGSDGHLAKWLTENSAGWKDLSCWTEAYKNPGKRYIEAEKSANNILEIAIVCIKKSLGSRTASSEELAEWVQDYGYVIRREIEMIRPKLVVCCGTFEHAKKICNVGKGKTKVMLLNSGANCFYFNGGFFVDFLCVGTRISKAAAYAYAKEVFQEINHYINSF